MSTSKDQEYNHSFIKTKGKEKVVDSSTLSSLYSKDTDQKCHDGMSCLMQYFERKCKIHYKGVGEYLASLFNLPTSPKSHGKPSSISPPCPSKEHFIQGSSSLLDIKEDESKRVQNVDISPHLFGKGYNLMKKMGYSRRDPFGRGMGIIAPLKEPFRPNTLKAGVGYLEQEYEGLPFYSRPSNSNKRHH